VGTEQFRLAQAEGKLLRLPTGDGGALVFRNNPEAPVLRAMEISKEIKRHPELQVRHDAISVFPLLTFALRVNVRVISVPGLLARSLAAKP